MELFYCVSLPTPHSSRQHAKLTPGLLCYMSTKVLLYYFLVEKVFIIRSPWKSRFKDKLYLFNVLGVILPYCILVVLSFIYRIAYINLGDNCIIGIDRNVLFPLVGFEIALNVSHVFQRRGYEILINSPDLPYYSLPCPPQEALRRQQLQQPWKCSQSGLEDNGHAHIHR
jgi:hypothetical protein